jgi:hypothetical protein
VGKRYNYRIRTRSFYREIFRFGVSCRFDRAIAAIVLPNSRDQRAAHSCVWLFELRGQ